MSGLRRDLGKDMNDTNNQNQNTGINPPPFSGSPNSEPVPVAPEVSTPYQPNQVSSSTIPLETQGSQSTSVMPQVSSEPFQGPQAENSAPSPFTEAESYQQPPQTPVNAGGAIPGVPVQPNTNLMTASQEPSGISKFRIFIIVAVLAIAAIYSMVTFLYLQNKRLMENVAEELPTTEAVVENEEPLPTVAPPVAVNSETIKILNGNVVLQESPSSESKIIVDKSDYSSTGITGFAKVTLSNDAKMLCFESWPPAPEPALYISDVEGNEIKEVSPNRQNCLWAKDNLSVFYTDYGGKTTPKNIYQYVVSSGEEKNLTLALQPTAKNWQYDIVGLSADGLKLICEYVDAKNVTNKCELDLSTLDKPATEEE